VATPGLLSMRATILIGLGLLSLALAAATSYDTEPLLEAPAGPYRGTVVDAENKRPLAGAGVVLIWQRPDPQFPQRRQTVAARDAMTDGAGQFVLEVASIEEQFAKQVFAPRIVIFKAGYIPYPRERQLFPPGYSALQFVGGGVQVLLKPTNADYDDQADAFNQFYEVLNSAHVPPADIPLTWQAVMKELQRLMATMPKPMRGGGRP
jgi:hypothetical protein